MRRAQDALAVPQLDDDVGPPTSNTIQYNTIHYNIT